MSYLADLFETQMINSQHQRTTFCHMFDCNPGFFTPVLVSAFDHLLQSAIEKSVLKFENKNIPGFKL